MQPILEALRLHDWYAVAALALTLITQLIRKSPYLQKAWAKIPDGYRWMIPIVSGAVTGFTAAFHEGLPAADAILGAVGGALGLGLPAMGLAAALKESPLPWDGGAGGKSPEAEQPPPSTLGPAVVLAVVLGFGTQSCASQQGDPLEQYMLGIRDGIAEAQLLACVHSDAACELYNGPPPGIFLSWDSGPGPLGKCSKVSGVHVITIYPRRIFKGVESIGERRIRLAKVVAHELQHARLTCGEEDHAAPGMSPETGAQ